MRILIIHLSDIHFKAEGNTILMKAEKICQAVQNMASGSDGSFIVISGDIVHSGKQEEYDQAMPLLDTIIGNLGEYWKKKPDCMLIPGNHDCDLEIKNRKVREILIENIEQNQNEVDESVIDQCCETHSNFFDFRELYHNQKTLLHSDKLLNIYNYEL